MSLVAAAPSRADYARCSLLLQRRGRIAGTALTHLEFRVLSFLLGQKPGAYAAHHQTIAAALDTNVSSVRVALGRLRAAGLVTARRIPPRHRLPSGRYARTSVCIYTVVVERVAPAQGGPAGLPQTDAQRGKKEAPGPDTRGLPAAPAAQPQPQPFQAVTAVASAHSDLAASTHPDSGASSGTRIRSEHKPPPTPSPPVLCGPEVEIPREEEALTQDEPARAPAPTPRAELRPIVAAWEAAGLPRVGALELRTLANRRVEGATLEELEAAALGAGEDAWVRLRARCPFAVVFCDLAAVRRFAHEGRKHRDAAPPLARPEARAPAPPPRPLPRVEAPAPPPEGIRAWLPAAIPRATPLTPEDFARRRAEQLRAVVGLEL